MSGKNYQLNEGINLFLKHVNANKSINTYFYYKKHLLKILQYLKDNKIDTFNGVTRSVLDDYVFYERDTLGNSNNTINKRIGALKTTSIYLFIEARASKQINFL